MGLCEVLIRAKSSFWDNLTILLHVPYTSCHTRNPTMHAYTCAQSYLGSHGVEGFMGVCPSRAENTATASSFESQDSSSDASSVTSGDWDSCDTDHDDVPTDSRAFRAGFEAGCKVIGICSRVRRTPGPRRQSHYYVVIRDKRGHTEARVFTCWWGMTGAANIVGSWTSDKSDQEYHQHPLSVHHGWTSKTEVEDYLSGFASCIACWC